MNESVEATESALSDLDLAIRPTFGPHHSSRGGQRGFPDEWGDIPQMMRTAKFVVLLAATIGR